MNITRGFNRIFVVLVIVWWIYCLLVYPIKSGAEALSKDTKEQSLCYEITDASERSGCVEDWQQITKNESERWHLFSYYRTDWLVILIEIIIIPALAYGFCRLFGFTAVWVYKGFRRV